MRRDTLHGFGLGLMVWLGWLIPFHRLPLPEHYAATALALALLLAAFDAHRLASVFAIGAALALLAVAAGIVPVWHARWLGPLMLIAALGALLRIASVSSTAISTRLARLLRDLAAGCVLAVVMLMVFLPLARLRMPILTAIVMLGVAFVANTLARRATR